MYRLTMAADEGATKVYVFEVVFLRLEIGDLADVVAEVEELAHACAVTL